MGDRRVEVEVLWLFRLQATELVAQAIGILAIVCVSELAIGSLKFHGMLLRILTAQI